MNDMNKFKKLMPIAVEVERGKNYQWCSCGKSQTPPLCDNQSPDCVTVDFVAERNETLFLCNCKHTKHAPLCDGSHSKLLLEQVKNKA